MLTAKLKLRHTSEQKTALDAVTLAYRVARTFRFGLGAQMACSVPR